MEHRSVARPARKRSRRDDEGLGHRRPECRLLCAEGARATRAWRIRKRHPEGNKIAVELNPSFAAAHCGFADSLTYLGRYDEAIARFEKAIALSTNDPQRWAFYTYGALALILKQDFERALEWTERASEIPNRQYWTLAHKAVALAYLGRGAEARRALDAAVAEQPNLGIGFARKKMYFLKRSDQLELYLDGLKRAGAMD